MSCVLCISAHPNFAANATVVRLVRTGGKKEELKERALALLASG